MNVSNFIFWLLHIRNLPTLLLTPLHLPCTSSTDYENIFGDCINLSIDNAHNFDDCVNTPENWTSTIVDLIDTPHITSLNLYIPTLAFLQLLLIYKSKIKIMFTTRSMICFFYLQHYSFMASVFHILHCLPMSKFTSWTSFALCSQYISICCFFFWISDSMYL